MKPHSETVIIPDFDSGVEGSNPSVAAKRPSMDAEEVLNSYLPPHWRITHLIRDDHSWQVIATDEEHVATATGGSIEEAIALTSIAILAECFTGRIFDGVSNLRSEPTKPLSEILNLAPKLPTITRRL